MATYDPAAEKAQMENMAGFMEAAEKLGQSRGVPWQIVNAAVKVVENGAFNQEARRVAAPTSNLTSDSPSLREEVKLVRPTKFNGADLAAIPEEDLRLEFLPLLGEEGWILRGFSNVIAGYPRVGKTELMARCVQEWVRAGHRVLYITEEPKVAWAVRLRGLGGDWSKLEVILGLGMAPALLMAEARASKAEIVVLDTIRNLLQIKDENNNSEIAEKVNPWISMSRLVNPPKTLAFGHHNRKGGGENGEGIAGGHALLGAFDQAIEVRRNGRNRNRRELVSYPRLVEQREAVYEKVGEGQFAPFSMVGDPELLKLEGVKSRLLEIVDGEQRSTAELLLQMEEPRPGRDTVNKGLRELAYEGKILRLPPIDEGTRQGVKYVWWQPERDPREGRSVDGSCPEHPGYPLVSRDGRTWCRRGQHEVGS